ncbi:unnamed protein product [Leptosia nina]|uniref:SCP domain-containing protein n=1 Tax=Leptosia nina TaxID=320188 RepID=A0AAV1JB63_9NEOP
MEVGQVIATVYGEAPRLNPATLVDLWYTELLNFNPAIISKFQMSSVTNLDHYDYFTQLIWANTSEVGCGASKFQELLSDNENRTVYRLVCNFLPRGNIDGHQIYGKGVPCTQCPSNSNCDLDYKSLCAPIYPYNEESITKQPERLQIDRKENSSKNVTDNYGMKLIDTDVESDIMFDLYSHLFREENNTNDRAIETTSFCKNVMAVDEFIDLLHKKLSTDSLFKDLIKNSTQSDIQYTDPKIDAIFSKIYSKKTIPTTTKSTDSEMLNSTLLVDLVEAVIFRNRDKISTVEINTPNTEYLEGKTVQMQAELGEIQRNLEFTGHFFFPEDGEENQSDPTEVYYDQSTLPVSEIIQEIEDLRRGKQTKDFVEEILEADFDEETVTVNHVITSDKMNGNT